MPIRPALITVLSSAVLALMLFSRDGIAQGGSQTVVVQINQQAMNAYANLQFQEAMQLLKQAEAMCLQYSIGGTPLSRTHLNMGIVEIGGNQNNAAGLEYFKKAVCTDPTVRLDPLNSTPEIETLFNMARTQAQTPGACGQYPVAQPVYPQPQPVYPQPQPVYPQPQPVYPQPQPPVPPAQQSNQLMRHRVVTQQKKMVPIPLYVEINPSVAVGKVILFYRTIGEQIYQQIEMDPYGPGYSAMIGCDVLQTFNPTGIDYYIALFSPSKQLLGTLGTEAGPNRTSFVDFLTIDPPRLPNKPEPNSCQEECPPWDQDCNRSRNCKQMGDLCDATSECCAGMVCIGEMCTASEEGSEGGGKGGGDFEPVFRMSMNAGTGVGLISGDDTRPYSQVSKNDLTIGAGLAWNKMHFRANPMFYITPDIQIGVEFRGDMAFDPDKNVDPLLPSVFANFAYRLVGEKPDGFELYSLFGLGWANLQHRVTFQDCRAVDISEDTSHPWYDPAKAESGETQIACEEESLGENDQWIVGKDAEKRVYFRKAGPFGIELGIDGYYWFADSFGFNFGVILDALIPKFALNLDVQAGIAFRF